MSLKIDSEFKNLIPPLTKEEYQGLEQKIITEGFDVSQGKLITWNGILVDGHNRYEICTRNKIQFETQEKQFDNRESVKEWIILNQFGRRNLSSFQRSELALQLKPLIQAKAKENLKTNTENQNRMPFQNSGKAIEKYQTDKVLAKIAGVSHDTIYKVEQIQKHASDEVKQKVKSGEMSIRQGYMITKPKEEKKVEIHKSDKLETKAKEVNKNKDIEELERLYEECKTIEPVNEINNNSTIIITEIRKIVNDSTHGLRIQIDNVKTLDSESKQAISQILEPIKNVLKDYEKIILEVTKNDK